MQHELQVALGERLGGIRDLRRRLPGALVPEHDRAGAIAGLDRALEAAVLDRVVLDLDGEPLVCRIEGGPPRDGPGLQDAVQFEPEVEVQPGRGMLLHHETQGRRLPASLPQPIVSRPRAARRSG